MGFGDDVYYKDVNSEKGEEYSRKAIKCLNKVIKLDPNFPNVWFKLATAYKFIDLRKVRKYAKKQLKIIPNHKASQDLLKLLPKKLGIKCHNCKERMENYIPCKCDNCGHWVDKENVLR